MKKKMIVMLALSVAIITVFITCMAVPCLADYKPGDEICISVEAVYVFSSDPNMYDSSEENGKFEITTDEDISVTVTTKEPLQEDARLVVRAVPTSDAEAYKWFSDCTKNIGENAIPFDIYFIDDNGNKIDVTTEMTITISLPDGYGTPIVCHLAKDGKTTVIESKADRKSVSFTVSHNSYYVITQKKDSGDSPPTGDVNTALLLIIVTVSLWCVASAIKRKRMN